MTCLFSYAYKSPHLILLIYAIGLVISPAATAATIDLREAERLALERNLALKATILDSRAAEARLRGSYGIYDPRLELSGGLGEDRQEINLTFVSTTDTEITEFRDFNLSLVQLFPTGGELTLFFDNRREESNSTSRLINPTYQNSAGISLVQPLLRNFGHLTTEGDILLAAADRKISLEELRRAALDLVSEVRNAYYDVIEAGKERDFRESSLALAEKVLRENQARFDVGMLAEVEVLEARVGHQLRQRDLLDATRAYQDALDRVALLLGLEQPPQLRLEEELFAEIVVDEKAAFLHALEKRPELLAQTLLVERLDLERKIAGNRRLPALDLVASYSHSGLGQDYDSAADDLGKTDFRSWEAGVVLSYPIGNRAAREEYARLDLRYDSERARLQALSRVVRTEIRQTIRRIEVSRKKVEVAERGSELAEEQLRTLLGRQQVGLATTREVLEGEEDLARVRTDRISALAEYNRAVTRYLRATGQLLEREGIRFADAAGATHRSPFRTDQE